MMSAAWWIGGRKWWFAGVGIGRIGKRDEFGDRHGA